MKTKYYSLDLNAIGVVHEPVKAGVGKRGFAHQDILRSTGNWLVTRVQRRS